MKHLLSKKSWLRLDRFWDVLFALWERAGTVGGAALGLLSRGGRKIISPPARRFRLTMEALEVRCTPAVLPNTFQFVQADFSNAEGIGQATIIAERGTTTGAASVDYATDNGTATAGASNDYLTASGTLHFADGVATASFNVTLNGDSLDEPSEYLSLVLSNPSSGYTIDTNLGDATLTIVDDDASPVAVADSYEVSHDIVLEAWAGIYPTLLANDSDADDDPLIAVLESGPSQGALQLNDDGSFVYTPPDGFVGDDSFAYQAYDGANWSDVVTVTIEIVNNAPTEVVFNADALDEMNGIVGFFASDDFDALEVTTYALVAADQYPDNDFFTIDVNELRVSPSATTATPGTYTIKVQATDSAQSYVTDTFDVTVTSSDLVWLDSVQDAVEGLATGFYRWQRWTSTGTLTVTYALDTASTTATEGTDFAPLSGTAVFADGQGYTDIVVDPTGSYADSQQESDEAVAIGSVTTVLGGSTILLQAAMPLLILNVQPGGGTSFSFLYPPGQTAYTFYLAEGSATGALVGEVRGQFASLLPWEFAIVSGNDSGYFQIDRRSGDLRTATDLPLTLGAGAMPSVRVRLSQGTEEAFTDVSITLLPRVLITGDFHGVEADIGNAGKRDLINLQFLRISHPNSQALTVHYRVDWGGASSADLTNPGDLVKDTVNGQDIGWITIPAGSDRIALRLTPTQNQTLEPMETFTVTILEPANHAYCSYSGNFDLGAKKAGFQGSNAAVVTIVDDTRLFASANANASLQDSAGQVNINDVLQGWTINCATLAAFSSLALRNPALLAQIMVQNDNGTVTVRFLHNGQAHYETVDRTLDWGLSQAQLRGDYLDNGAVSRAYEIWPMMLEKALAQFLGTPTAYQGSIWSVWTSITGQGYELEEFAGYTPEAVAGGLAEAYAAGAHIVLQSHISSPGTSAPIPVVGSNPAVAIYRWHAYTFTEIDGDYAVFYDPAAFQNNLFVRVPMADLMSYFRRAIIAS